MICNSWDVVVVPFPFVDNANTKPRPAVVLSSVDFNQQNNHSIMAMITTASNINWAGDVAIQDLSTAGLPVKSFIRMKLFTLDNRLIKKKIGGLDNETLEALKASMTNYLPYASYVNPI